MKRWLVLLLACALVTGAASADFKDITLQTISEYQQCIEQSEDFSQEQMLSLSNCFEQIFTEDAPDTTIPPDPGPGPGPGNCINGNHPLAGWWAGFCGDETRNFPSESNNTIGVMHTNADCGKIMSQTPVRKGSVSFEVFFRTAQLPQDLGGGHMFTACSGEKHQVPDFLKSWWRPDVTVSGSQWTISTYNNGPNGEAWFERSPGRFDHVIDVWRTALVPQVGRWIKLKLEWDRRADDRMWMRFSQDGQSKERTLTIHPQTKNPYYVMFGNEDHLEQFGGTPEIAFRNLVWQAQ